MSDFHKLVPDAFEAAAAEAHGAIAGWCMGNGEDPPFLTAVRKTAYEHAFAAAFNAGWRAAVVEARAEADGLYAADADGGPFS